MVYLCYEKTKGFMCCNDFRSLYFFQVYACGDNRKNKLALLTEEELESFVDAQSIQDCLVFRKVIIAFVQVAQTQEFLEICDNL